MTRGVGTGWPRSLRKLTAALPPVVNPTEQQRAAVRRSLIRTATTVIALDDDPTGSQVVHDVEVVTGEDPADLASLLDAPSGLGFVLTNSRALGRTAAVALNQRLAERLLTAAASQGRRVEFVSRGDSTLRGHFPAEPETLMTVLAEAGQPVDLITLCPAFPEAGRITIDGLHLVGTADGFVPAGESEFARDATFGYRASSLPAWIEERTGGDTPASAVTVLSAAELRTKEPAQIAQRLAARERGAIVAIDAVVPQDLSMAAIVLATLRTSGHRLLHRSGPSLLGPLVGQRPIDPLGVDGLRRDRRAPGGGIVVVGSHTTVSTRQLAELLGAVPGLLHVELDVPSLLADAAGEVDRVLEELAVHAAGQDVVISTSRQRVDGADRADSLALARRVSDAVVRIVGTLVKAATPAYLVAKGGITSSEVATSGLGVRRATVLGQLRLGQLSVWELGPESTCPGLPYVVFPGNVGDHTTLAAVVALLRDARQT